MSVRLLPRRWLYKPPSGVDIDYSDPLARQLSNYWPMNEGGGMTLYDLAGRNHAAFTTSPEPIWNYTNASFQSLRFIGSDVLFNNGPGATLNSQVLASTTAPFSVSVWYFIRGSIPLGGYPHILTFKGSGTTPWELTLSDQTSYEGVLIGSASDWVKLKSGSSQSDITGKWRHVVITFDGVSASSSSSFAGYLDGVPLSFSAAGAFSTLTNSSTFGKPPSGGSSNLFNGWISEIARWDRVLTPSEVQRLWTEPLCLFRKQSVLSPLVFPDSFSPSDFTVSEIDIQNWDTPPLVPVFSIGATCGVFWKPNPSLTIAEVDSQYWSASGRFLIFEKDDQFWTGFSATPKTFTIPETDNQSWDSPVRAAKESCITGNGQIDRESDTSGEPVENVMQ